jgi:predicted glycoside hydrolase/deacetylase ChbG (UPF0249 family)
MRVEQSRSKRGLLIVNADDLGYDAHHTDCIRECLTARRITSATAMVYMEDSDRASAILKNADLGIGLHLNLSEAFTDSATPARVRARQARLLSRFHDSRPRRLHRWLYDPLIKAAVERSIADQFQRFQELYGKPPTHVDGHQHVHLSPNVFLTGAIPRGMRMRNTLHRDPVRRLSLGVARTIRQRAISARFCTTDHLFDINDVDPRRLAPGQASPWLRFADSAAVEVMAHPGFPHEFDCLMSSEWEKALAGRRLGSFAELDHYFPTSGKGRT